MCGQLPVGKGFFDGDAGWSVLPCVRPVYAGLFPEEGQHLCSPRLAAENHTTLPINAMDLKNTFRKINIDRDSFSHRMAPVSLWFRKPPFWHLDTGGCEPSTAL
jgi:hypothetical protein